MNGPAGVAAKTRRSAHRNAVIALASCVAVAGSSIVGWRMAAASHAPAQAGRGHHALGSPTKTAASAAPASAASAGGPGSAVQIADHPLPPALPPAIANDLASLKLASDRWDQQRAAIEQRLAQLEGDVAQLHELGEERAARYSRALRQASAATARVRSAPAATSTAEGTRPRILSVDTWNGRPSVALLVGSEVRFASEGDVVANTLVRRADPVTQRIEAVPTAAADTPAGEPKGAGR